MSETDHVGLLTTDSTSAGSLLRQARVAKGMHLATLAAAIKVPQRKLESLEADQWDQLPDMAFARALAQTVCRTLRIDPATVMALLPNAKNHRIEQLGEGLNAPFRERSGKDAPPIWSRLRHPGVWGSILVLLAALAVYAAPPDWIQMPEWWSKLQNSSHVEGASSSEVSPTSPSTVTETIPTQGVTSVPTTSEAVVSLDAHSSSANSLANPLELRVTLASWVEVQDGQGKILLGRIVQPNEPLSLGGALPLRLKIGNAGATEVKFRGQRIDLAASTRDNVARLELN